MVLSFLTCPDLSLKRALPPGCRLLAGGRFNSSDDLREYLAPWHDPSQHVSVLLVLAGTRTAEQEGISAAGATPDSRRYTAVADAELLLTEPGKPRCFTLPPLAAGVTPALISQVACSLIDLRPIILVAGLEITPTFPHLQVEASNLGPAACLSSGQAMSLERVKRLCRQGQYLVRHLQGPLLLTECVPGGTTTALAVLSGLGLYVKDLVSGSARYPPRQLKCRLVERGLAAADLAEPITADKLLAAVGDPFQALALGLLQGAWARGKPVMLGGGSQMVAVLALALSTHSSDLPDPLAQTLLVTTPWLAEEGKMEQLLYRLAQHFHVMPTGLSSGLRFHNSKQAALRDYENGFVKEGVGAGALTFLAQLRGHSRQQILKCCDNAAQQLRELQLAQRQV
ncbi:TIGR00303 family protein [cyanobiont of Ornithocercus magnificus]|nr:TIGR00303 family protein [cyanobiont of Ornithocercus magnificus]